MNDLYEDMRHDEAQTDPAMTRRVVDRWLHERAARRRRNRVLAFIGPLSAAAVLLLSVVLINHRIDARRHDQRLAASRAVSTLVGDARKTTAVKPQNIDDTINTTANLFSADTLLALLIPDDTDDPTETTP